MEYLHGSKVNLQKQMCSKKSSFSSASMHSEYRVSDTKPSADHRTAWPPGSNLECITMDHSLMALNDFLVSTMATPILERGYCEEEARSSMHSIQLCELSVKTDR